MIVHVLMLAGGIGVLYFGAEWLVRGAARLARELGVRPIVVGLTVVSLGTSAPELVVGIVASLGGNGDLVLGNVLGSNLANIGLILGLTALVRPLDVASRVVWREMPLMILVTLVVYPLAWDHMLTRLDGAVFLLVLVSYMVFFFRSIQREKPEIVDEYEEFVKASAGSSSGVRLSDVGRVVVGSIGLVLGGWAIVGGAVAVAQAIGVSQVVIGLTVVAIGTSLPELATSLVAALKNEADIAVGNVIGSNIFNVAGILGVSSLVHPIPVGSEILRRELPAVIGISLIVFPLLRTGWRIQRWEGAVLLGCYVLLGFWLL